jgi:hypothetical protein
MRKAEAKVASNQLARHWHNTTSGHGPDMQTFKKASTALLQPQKIGEGKYGVHVRELSDGRCDGVGFEDL